MFIEDKSEESFSNVGLMSEFESKYWRFLDELNL